MKNIHMKFKTGITVDYISSWQQVEKWGCGVEKFSKIKKRTVDGNGNGLVENVAISTDEGWDLAETVVLEVLSIDALGWLNVDDLKIDVVGLGHSPDGSRARVGLHNRSQS
jgi:hypothetical protein